MSSFLPETAKSSIPVLINDILPISIFKISLVVAITYISTLKIKNGKNEWFPRIKKYKKLIELVNKYPGVNFYPLVGSTFHMVHLVVRPCQDFFPWVQRMSKSCGPIFRFWFFNQPKLVITCPDLAIACLRDESFPGRSKESTDLAKILGGEGLIVIPPDIHGPRKKIWRQWFTRLIIDGNLPLFQREAIRFCYELSTRVDQSFDLLDYALHCTFRTIASSAFGEEYMNSISEADAKQHFHSLTSISIKSIQRIFRPWLANNLIYFNFTADGRQTMKCIKKAHKLTYDAIKYAKMLRNNKARKMDSGSDVPYFLDHLLDMHEQGCLTENDIFQELNNFLVGGYDTTGLSISWTLYLLALHPECQSKVVEELSSIFEGNLKHFSGQVTTQHLQSMRYLELCIKESLRLYPAFAILLRRSANDKTVIMPDGNVIPAGVDLFVPLRIIHKDPKYFPEPEKFIPERHLVSIPAYIPFGLGSRNCVGQTYAIQELKMILAYLLMEYKWETLEKPGLEPLMVPTSYPKSELRFKISIRGNV